ncbi:MAG: hypothetical protein ACOZBW_10230 [Thermodesulfobacteriota bacterium]
MSPPQAGEFLTAPKKPLARGKPKAKPRGCASLGTFLGGKKSTRIKKRERMFLEKPPHIKFDSDSDFDPDPDSDTDLDKQIKRCDAMVKTVFGQQRAIICTAMSFLPVESVPGV